MTRTNDPEVLVVGAGPTGLALACQLARFGIPFRIIDKQADRTRESRALGVQARSLEVLQSVGLGEILARRGRKNTRVMLHVDRGTPATLDLGDVGRGDTRFPYVLFVSQADTEAVMTAHLESGGRHVERRVELTTFREDASGVLCALRHDDGREEAVRVSYLVGCDGAHSTVRKGAGIPFEGGAYPQQFALGDVEADGALVSGAINAFALGRGVAMFFPLGDPATWRVIAMDPTNQRPAIVDAAEDVSTYDLSLAELQAMVDDPTRGTVHLHDPVWLTRFRLHHRQAARYQEGRIFLAGDAAHIHSPVGAQGMNTGIQDAWNLGWKIAMVSRGWTTDRILASYHAERWPVGRTLLQTTDRLFSAIASSVSGPSFVGSLRRLMVRWVVAPALSRRRLRAIAFHFVSQLGIRYRSSPVVAEGTPLLRHGPKAGDRLPDARVQRGAHATYLQQELSQPRMHLLMCGPIEAWDTDRVKQLADQFHEILSVTYLVERISRTTTVGRVLGEQIPVVPSERPSSAFAGYGPLAREDVDGALVDVHDEALRRLGVESTAQFVVRPDGHVGFRCAGTDLTGASEYLHEWLIPRSR